MLAGAVCAALTMLITPPIAANPQPPGSAEYGTVSQAVSAFYASRRGAPLWLRDGRDSAAARQLITILRRAPLDGFQSGPALASQADALIAQAQAGDPAALTAADALLSTAWVLYVQALQTPPAGMTYDDPWVAPRRDAPALILARAATAPSLSSHLAKTSNVNPIYAQLREAAWNAAQANGGQVDPRVLASLDRARDMPFQNRYIMVDAAGARLYMIENGQIADSMKVIVGKSTAPTPMLASTIYYATLNPYWHVSGDMIRTLIAPNVLNQGLSYLRTRGYQVISADGSDATLLDPAKIDWRAVAAGQVQVKVRQLPGPANSMGRIKFGFSNPYDIYLHDTPGKDLFTQDDRGLSHGCIRLEDARRLGRWLMRREPTLASAEPEQNVTLPTPVPIYVTYLTAQASDGRLSFVHDIYGWDSQHGSQVAALVS
jgi:murein L,D-transpeptidase YcbB/YkuD